MRNKLTLALALTIALVVLLAAPVERGAAQTTLSGWIHCEAIDYPGLWCQANLSGGVPPYTYNWTPDPVSGWYEEAETILPCQRQLLFPQSGVFGTHVTLTVTDSYGATLTRRSFFECGWGTPQ